MKKFLSCFFSFALMLELVGTVCRAEETGPQKEVVSEETKSKIESKEVNDSNIGEQMLDYIKEVLFNVRDFGIKNYPVFKSWLNRTYYGTKGWTSEKFGALKAWLYNSTKEEL